MFKKRNEGILAIDLAPDAVRLLAVTTRRGAPHISAVAGAALEAGPQETLPERHLAALEGLVAKHRMRAKRCVAAMPTNLVVTRSVTVDPAKGQKPEEQIRLTLQNCLPYDSRDLIFDFWPVSDAPANRAHDVLVVATQASVVHRYLTGLEKMRLSCVHMDVAPCALAALIGKLQPNQDAMVGTIALTETLGYFAVVEKQRVLFWRPFEIPSAAKIGVQGGLARVGDEISKCISHMVGTLHLEGMGEIITFGQGAEAGFNEYLTHRFNLQVRSPSPFESLPSDAILPELLTGLDPSAATHYATALGLALQSPGGAYHG